MNNKEKLECLNKINNREVKIFGAKTKVGIAKMFATYNIFAANAIAIQTLYDFVEAMKKSELYCRKNKMLTNKVQQLMWDYERKVNREFKESNDFMMDYQYRASQRAKELLQKEHKNLIRIFDRHNIANSETLAHMELARVVTEAATKNLLLTQETFREVGVSINYIIKTLNLDGLQKAMESVCTESYKSFIKIIHADPVDKESQKGIDDILDLFFNAENVSECLDYAIESEEKCK